MKAIVFDFDGVIVETEEPEFLAWRSIWSEFGEVLPLREWASCVGTRQSPGIFDPFGELVRRTGLALDEQAARARSRAIASELIKGRPAQAGLVGWLDAAVRSGLGIGLASSSERAWIEPHLRRLGLRGYFSVIAAWDDCGACKPDPASYLLACRELGVGPGEALAVEDSRNGLLAAKAAGLRCVVVPSTVTAHMDFSEADLVLGSLADAGPKEVVASLVGRGGASHRRERGRRAPR